jgi:hypothetical protein
MRFWCSKEARRARAERVYRDNTITTYEGISLCNLSNQKSNELEFIDSTKKALDLVLQNDLRRFRRIQRFISYIVNRELISGGNYDERLRACNVDFTFFKVREDFEWYLLQYAGLLVHESTHGLIAVHGIPYNRKTRMRIERLSKEEEKRFFMKISSPWNVDDFFREDDERWLKQYWGFWSRMRLHWKRAKEIVKSRDR